MARAREEELVQRSRAGDAAAFAALVAEHQRFVYSLALRALGSPEDAQDVAQEAFVSAWLGIVDFRGRSSLRTWLYRIAINLCYKRLPSLRRELAALPVDELVDPPGQQQADPVRQVEDAEQRAFLHRQIEALPPSYRLLIALRYQQGLSYEEVAATTGLTVGAVKVGLFRARARLREALSDWEGACR